jgi:hypothetical protein
MRVTLILDPKLHCAAKHLASERSATLGDIISELANVGLSIRDQGSTLNTLNRKTGFPVFNVPAGSAMIGLDDVIE